MKKIFFMTMLLAAWAVTAQAASFSATDSSYDIRSRATLNAADAAAFTADRALVCVSTYTINSPTTITAAFRAEKGCRLIKSGSGTLTINGPFSAGLYTVFSGFKAGEVTFGAGNTKEVYPEWWGVTGTNDENAVNMAVTSLPSGGLVQLLRKTYNFQTNTVIMKSGVTIRGAGGMSGNMGNGTLINTSLTRKAAFTAGSGTHFVGIERLVIMSKTLTAGRHGIECAGTVAGGNSLGFDINHVHFLRLDKGLYVRDSSGAHQWMFSQIEITHSRSDEGNVTVQYETLNAELRSAYNYFNFLDKGFNLLYAGVTTLEQTFGGAQQYTGLGAFVYAEHAMRLSFRACQAEQLAYFLYIPAKGSANYGFVTLLDCVINAPVVVQGQRTILSMGNLYNGGNTQLADALFTSLGDYYSDGKEGGGFVASKLLLHDGAFATILNSAKASQVPDGYIQQSPQAAVASAAIITPTGSLFHVTGSMAIETIKTPWNGFSGRITIIPDGGFTWTSTGNIAVSGTAVVSKAITFTFDWNTRKWYPSY